jgi:hypothetical protein
MSASDARDTVAQSAQQHSAGPTIYTTRTSNELTSPSRGMAVTR